MQMLFMLQKQMKNAYYKDQEIQIKRKFTF